MTITEAEIREVMQRLMFQKYNEGVGKSKEAYKILK